MVGEVKKEGFHDTEPDSQSKGEKTWVKVKV